MDPVLAAQAFEPLGHIDHGLNVVVDGVHVPEVGRHLEPVGVLLGLLQAGRQRGVAAHDERRYGLGDPVAHRVRVAQHAGRVAHGGPGLDLGERHDLGHVIAAVLLGCVADHLVAVPRVEVHVDVGHGNTTRVQESLEQQVVLDGVQVGDPEAVGHRTARRAPPARADPDVPATGVADEVPRDQKVRREAHLANRGEFVGQTLDDLVLQQVTPPLAGPLEGQVLEVGVGPVEPLGDREVGQLRVAELDLHLTPLGDPQGVVTRRGHVTEQIAHLGGRLQVVLLAGESEAVRVTHQGAGLHTQQRVMGPGVVTMGVVAVVGGQQRGAQVGGQLLKHRVGPVLLGDALVLEFDEQVVLPEDLLEAGSLDPCVVVVVADEGLEHVPAKAAGRGDQTLGVVRKDVPVDPGLVVVALQESPAGHLDQVAVPGVALGQEREVVHELAPTISLTTGVIDPSTAGRALEPGVVGHVGLGTQDRFDPPVATGPIEVEDPVHVAVVGDPEGRLTVSRRGVDQVADPSRPVQHGKLGVDMEMGEAATHGTRPPSVAPPRSSQVGPRTHVGPRFPVRRSRLQLAAAHPGQLLLSGHLLGEQRGLNSLDETLEPTHQLSLGDPKLVGAGGCILGKRQSQTAQFLTQVWRQRGAQLGHRRGVDLPETIPAGLVEGGQADLLEELAHHRAHPHHLGRMLDRLVDLVVERTLVVRTLGRATQDFGLDRLRQILAVSVARLVVAAVHRSGL